MQAEDVRSDEALRELVVRAFDNITGLSDQISERYLSRFFNIFHLMYTETSGAQKPWETSNWANGLSEKHLSILRLGTS